MSVRVRQVEGRTIVWLEGEHDLATSAMLADILTRVIAADDADVVIDMSEVRFVALATIDVLAAASASLRSGWRELTVRAPSRGALRMLQLCGLDEMVEAEPAHAGR